MNSNGLDAERENTAGVVGISRSIEGEHDSRLDTRRPRSLDVYALQMSPSWPRLHPPTRSRSLRIASGVARTSSMTGAHNNRRQSGGGSANSLAETDVLDRGGRPKENGNENTLDTISGSSSDGSREPSVVEPQTKAAMQQHFDNIGTAGPSSAMNASGGANTIAAQGPQHPYELYPQNTIEDGAPSLPPLSIPVGFLGLQQSFQQQTYPQQVGARVDESQQIIGPLGHVEELPPYTRYPTQQVVGASVERSPQDAVPSGNSADPVPASTVSSVSPPDPLQQTPSTRSLESDNSRRNLQGEQATSSSEDPPAINEKSRPLKRRCCNGKVPIWVLLLVIALCLLLFGTLLGVMMRNRNHKRSLKAAAASASSTTTPLPQATVYATLTATYDASLLPYAPTNAPRPPPGKYGMSMGAVQSRSEGCLANRDQYATWDCHLATGEVQVEVTPAQEQAPALIEVSIPDPSSSMRRYGTQPPVVRQPQKLSPAQDQERVGLGVSYFFQVPYDKLVILEAGKLIPSGGSRQQPDKRDLDHALLKESGWNHQKRDDGGKDTRMLQPGDEPWYCYWNHTILEGFIYVTQNSTTSTSISSLLNNSGGISSSTTIVGSSSSSIPTPVTTTTTNNGKPEWLQQKQESNVGYSAYPKVVKLLEISSRHARNGFQPYCQQMKVLSDYRLGVINKPGTNDPMIINLNETDSSGPPPPFSGGGPPPSSSGPPPDTKRKSKRSPAADFNGGWDGYGNDGDKNKDSRRRSLSSSGDDSIERDDSIEIEKRSSPPPPPSLEEVRKLAFQGGCTCSWIIGREG